MELRKVDQKRRGFLRAATGAGALGALAAMGGANAQPAAQPQAQAEPAKRQGYHETEHIRKYYATARYW